MNNESEYIKSLIITAIDGKTDMAKWTAVSVLNAKGLNTKKIEELYQKIKKQPNK